MSISISRVLNSCLLLLAACGERAEVPGQGRHRLDVSTECARSFTGEPKINDSLQIAAQERAGVQRRAVLLMPDPAQVRYCPGGSVTSIGDLWNNLHGVDENTTPMAINNSGAVAGVGRLPGYLDHAFFFGPTASGGQVVDLAQTASHPTWEYDPNDGHYYYAGLQTLAGFSSYGYGLREDNVVVGSALGSLCTLGYCMGHGVYAVEWHMKHLSGSDTWEVDHVEILSPYVNADPHLHFTPSDRALHRGDGGVLVGWNQGNNHTPSIFAPPLLRQDLPTPPDEPVGPAVASVTSGGTLAIFGHYRGPVTNDRPARWTLARTDLDTLDASGHTLSGVSATGARLAGSNGSSGVMWESCTGLNGTYVPRTISCMNAATGISRNGLAIAGYDAFTNVFMTTVPTAAACSSVPLPCVP